MVFCQVCNPEFSIFSPALSLFYKRTSVSYDHFIFYTYFAVDNFSQFSFYLFTYITHRPSGERSRFLSLWKGLSHNVLILNLCSSVWWRFLAPILSYSLEMSLRLFVNTYIAQSKTEKFDCAASCVRCVTHFRRTRRRRLCLALDTFLPSSASFSCKRK